MIVAGSGARVQDIHGRSYIDGMAGLWCVNVGYGRVELAETMRAHAERLGYYHAFSSMGTDTPGLLAERLIEMAPPGMSKVFFGCTGSDANDTQVKLVWFYNNVLGRPEKKKIISRSRGYHGVSVMSAGLTGLPGLHDDFDLPLPMIRHTTAPHRLWEAEPGMTDEEFAQKLADDLEALILAEGPETVAAFIAEPVMGAGGVIVPPATYFERIQAVLRRYDVLLIADEVITAFGRLGQLVRQRAVRDRARPDHGRQGPDLRLLPALGLHRLRARLARSRRRLGERPVRPRLHLLGPSARGRGRDDEPRPDRERRARRAGGGAGRAAARAAPRGVRRSSARRRGARDGADRGARVRRAQGSRRAVRSRRSRSRARVTRRCLELGLITRALPAADTISFSPPFVITEDEVGELVRITRQAVDEVAAELRSEA